jgi:hypothetical protein
MLMLSKPALQVCALSESSDAYPNIKLNAGWRVILCRDGIQWILQRRHGPERPAGARWEGRAYCRIHDALIRCCRAYSGAIDPVARAVLEVLPAWAEPTGRAR